ncbi:O-antigen ligase family protein [Candidatus Uabimicrobium amorphum]|uniref:Ligase n=1 Tax=Uabimicrobium amorphum TaxID=2596890 RepID=A0A5S9IQD1_UABAM|nr:O-antigen ligase family protein [Candidatus Uabimicrobium amorphum]BBM85706.1 ligase [Candidatus Uabimicrobium amorphum]
MQGIYFILWGIVPLLCFSWFSNQFFPKVTLLYLLTCVFCIQLYKSKKNVISNEHMMIFVVVIFMAMSFSIAHLQYWIIILLLAIIFSHAEEKQIMTTLYSLCAAATVASIYGIYQYTASTQLRVNTFPTYTSSFSLINTAGAFISCSCMLTMSLAVVNFPKHTPLLLVSFVLQLSYLMCTGSRAGYVAFAITFLLFAIVVITRQFSLRLKHLLLILGVFVITIAASLLYTPVKQQTMSIFDSKNNSNKVRLYMWESTWDMTSDYLWSGVGSGKFIEQYPLYRNKEEYTISDSRVATHPHNDFLLIVAENGIFILALFIVLLFFSLRKLYRGHNGMYLCGLSILICLLINACFYCVFIAPTTALLLGISLGIAAQKSHKYIHGNAIFPLLLIVSLCGLCTSLLQSAANIHFHSGQKHMKTKKYDKAITQLQKAQSLWSDHNTHLEMGRCYLVKKQPQKAQMHLEKAQATYLENAYLTLGICYTHIKEHHKAFVTWKQALRLYPESWQLNYNLGKLCLDIGKAPQAVNYLNKALLLREQLGKDIDFLMNIGLANEYIGQYGKAMTFYSKAKEKDKRKIVPTMYIANTLVKMRLFPSALHHLEFVAKNGKKAEIITANISMAKIYEELQQPKIAMTLCFKVISLDRNNYEANFLLGRSLFFQKKYKMGVKFLGVARSASPQNPWPPLFLALTHFEQNQHTQAIMYLQKAKDLGFSSWKELYQVSQISSSTKQKIQSYLQKK